MMTSYFGKRKLDMTKCVSIALKTPDWFTGRDYKKLAPKYYMISNYKMSGDWKKYEIDYRREILDKLDPIKVYNELGDDSILCCYERSGVNCHRHLVALWLMGAIGYLIIKELV